MSVRIAAVLTALFGIATLAITYAFAALPEARDAVSCATNGLLVQFEFARTPAALEGLFGRVGMDCHQLRLDSVNAQNLLDIRAYIPCYAAFMAFAAWFVGGRASRPVVIAAILVAVIAAWSDLWETTALLDLARRVDQPNGFDDAAPLNAQLAILTIASRLKFALIGVHGLLIALAAFTGERKRRILGALALFAAPATAVLIATGGADERMALAYAAGMTLAWTPIMLTAAKEAILPGR